MSPPCTANEDQPGPTVLRQITTGGDWDQSVAIVTPETMLSRLGPRKPGHSGVTAAGKVGLGATAGAAGSETAVSTGGAGGVGSTGGAGGVGIGLASSSCSVVGDQCQA